MIYLVGSEATEVPAWFKRRLRDIDAALVVYWNRFQGQFCIDRCVKGSDCLSSDHVSCQKSNVLMFPHMGEAPLDKLKSMDLWNKFGGNDEDALARYRRTHAIDKEEYDAKQREAARETYMEVALDNRVQINKALHLIQQHDIARVH